MRKRNSGMNRLAAYALGPAIALFVLLATFSLLPYEWLTATWPLGITQDEVAAYQRWFDHRPGETAATELPVLSMEGDVPLTAKPTLRVVTLGDGHARLSVARVQDVIRVAVEADTAWQALHAFELVPLDPGLARLVHLREVAATYAALVPTMRLVRLEMDGEDLGPRLLVERITPGRIARAGLLTGPMITVFGNKVRLLPAQGAGLSDAAAMAYAALLDGERSPMDTTVAALHAWFTAAGFASYMDTARFVLDPYSGRLLPVLDLAARGAAEDRSTWSARSYPLAEAWRQALGADTAGWLARLAAIDAQWAPALSDGGSTAFLEAGLRQQRQALLSALVRPNATPVANGRAGAVPVLDPWLKPYLGADDTLRFPRGKHRIDRTVECPAGMGVVLEKGARLTIAPGASWVINGPLHIRGTGLNPVFIRPVDPASPFGGIAVNGSSATRCRVRGLRMSGGTSTTEKGRLHPGMLSFHDCDLVVDASELAPASGPGALDVRGGRALITGTQASSGTEAVFTLGRTAAELRQCTLTLPAGTAGTTVAVRVEGGRAAVLEGRMDGPFATGVEATGSALVLVRGCRFSGSAVAMAADLGALLHANDCIGEGVEVPFRAGSGGGRKAGRVEASGNTFAGAVRSEEHMPPGTVRFVEGMDSLMVRVFGSVR